MNRNVLHRRFKFVPATALIRSVGPYAWAVTNAQWFAAYQWFMHRLCEWKKRSRPYEVLNGTSSINNHAPDPLHSFYEPTRRLAILFAQVGSDSIGADFLRYCRIRKWADLGRPITIALPHTDRFPHASWFEMVGRTFKTSPNDCHPQATWVQNAAVEIDNNGQLWGLRVEYGYRHDASSWYHRIPQNLKERLDDFVQRANVEMDALLTPDERGRFRVDDERDWHRSRRALQDLFWDEHSYKPFWEHDMADLLSGVKGTSLTANRIVLTPRRMATLKRWARSGI
jgi:hypothetical protein